MTTQNLEQVLAAHPFFSGMPPGHVELLAGCASNTRFEEGEFVLREGDEANEFYLIRQGKVALEVFAPGRGSIEIQTLGEGDILGWSWLVPPYYWRFDARALEMTRAFTLDGRCLRQKCDADQRLGYELLKRFARVMVDHLQAARFRLLNVYASETAQPAAL